MHSFHIKKSFTALLLSFALLPIVAAAQDSPQPPITPARHTAHGAKELS